ncbi:sulfite oxidase [Plectosphaerella plurivora]|uniref:Nitrate reductase [NADPH] n=1 Tax=Plectosphaerella plurivora TaxID=936078 RepID=A0A9P8V247_9PEZI|nr:sulfite oxidase [Plectosphaerella plurivora]
MQAPRRILSGLQQLRPAAARAVCPGPKPCRRFLSSPGAPRPSTKGKTDQKSWRRLPRRSGAATVSLLASGGVVSLALGLSEPSKPAAQEHAAPASDSDTRDPKLPRFRLSEVRQHDAKSDRPWVTRGDKVYDITDWVGAHPGGDVILRAAGGSIDPYWDIFAIHKAPHVYEILAQYEIGLIHSADLVDGRPPAEALEDPFRDDPDRDPRLLTLTVKPRNAETPIDELVENFITPNELFYVRNHMWVPQVEKPAAHTLIVELMDGSTKEYTLEELKSRFKPVTIAATLQCSGNRRRDMTLHSHETQGLQWNVGAISCAVWEGVKLVDVLADAGFSVRDARDGNTDARHVQFAGLESYGASIPIEPVIDPRGDVILAYAMNGKPLPPDHGFPLRALVPGHVAARSVKWLNKVIVSDEESQSQWQQKDYKLFGPNVIHPDWQTAPAIQEMPITSAIASVKLGDWVSPATPTPPTRKSSPPPSSPPPPRREVALAGYAYSGGGRRIVRVDVSLDNGKTWDQARLADDCTVPGPDSASQRNGHKSWTWRRWHYDGIMPLGDASSEPGSRCSTLLVKATDEVYNSQPDQHDAIWNLRGNLANAWHRLKVCSECSEVPKEEVKQPAEKQ